VRYLGSGLRLWAKSPKLMLLGAIPALIVGAVYAAAIVLFILNLDGISTAVTPFASGWLEPWRSGARIVAGAALTGGVVLLAVFSFVAVTLTVGDVFYERIWRAIERQRGGEPAELEEPFWRSALRGIGGGLRLLVLTATVGVVLFACGFIPVVGQTVVPVVGALVGGWLLTVELTGYAFDARGFTFRQRRRMLARDRASALGFGAVTYLLFLVPFAAVIIMPAAVAGATLLARDVLARDVLARDALARDALDRPT
jgi:CysZ protein